MLLIVRIDRLARSLKDLLHITERLDAAGVVLRCSAQAMDTEGPLGKLMLQSLGMYAEFERSVMIQRITDGFERKASRGEWVGGPPPFGYKLDSAHKTLAIVEDEAVLVRTIFSKYVNSRMGGPALAEWLNSSGRTTRKGNRWTSTGVLNLLANPAYIGRDEAQGRSRPCQPPGDRR